MTKWTNTEIVSDSLFDPFLWAVQFRPLFCYNEYTQMPLTKRHESASPNAGFFYCKKYWQNIGNMYKIEEKTAIKMVKKGEKTRINAYILGIFKIPPSPPFITNEAEMLLFLYLLRGFGPFSEHIQIEYWQNIGKMLK